MQHKPVLLYEALDSLALKSGDTVVDGTLGNAGHSLEILNRIGKQGKLIGLDRDPESIRRCREILKPYPQAVLYQENYREIKKILTDLNIQSVNAVLLDVGFSSYQIEDASRGFSFDRDGPLDMRFNPQDELSAEDLVNALSENELERVFHDYGEESWARRIAAHICLSRRVKRIQTTFQLVEIVNEALPGKFRIRDGKKPFWMRRHPATKVFQALRIAVNEELKSLSEGLENLWACLENRGRLSVISFHSLEDRIVKNFFREKVSAGSARLIFKKPVCAGETELAENPRARSAKLRTAEKSV